MVKSAVIVKVLTPKAHIKEPIKQPLPFDKEIIKDDFVWKRMGVPVGFGTPSELVRNPRIETPDAPILGLALHFAPNTWADTQMLREIAAYPREEDAAARKPWHVLHDLLTDAQVGPRVKVKVTPRDPREKTDKEKQTALHRTAPPCFFFSCTNDSACRVVTRTGRVYPARLKCLINVRAGRMSRTSESS